MLMYAYTGRIAIKNQNSNEFKEEKYMYIDINMIEKAREMFLIVAVDSLLPAAVSYILSHIWNRGRQKIPGIFDKCRRIGKCKSKV